VIMLTRLNGPPFALNPDLVERVEETPDTVITLVDGKHYLVAEPLQEVMSRVQHARAQVLAAASLLQQEVEASVSPRTPSGGSEVVPLRRNS